MKNKKMNEKWKEAGILLANDPKIKIPCPVCRSKQLEVIDIDGESVTDVNLFERVIFCSNCNGRIYLRMHHKNE
ncbi:hypothetical protein [Sebaldella termitidis]|uniref:hypothetical protein n=1 Tax=Sebaldella termitidis TaxID=826 RepID=UPI003EB80C98